MRDMVANFPSFSYSLTSKRESYRLGLLSGLLLRSKNSDNWQVERGNTPTNILLNDVPKIVSHDDVPLKTKSVFKQKKLPTINEFKSKEYYRLAIELQKLGTLKTAGFYSLTEETDIDDIISDFTGALKLNSVTVIKVNEVNLIENSNSACGKKS